MTSLVYLCPKCQKLFTNNIHSSTPIKCVCGYIDYIDGVYQGKAIEVGTIATEQNQWGKEWPNSSTIEKLIRDPENPICYIPNETIHLMDIII